MYPINININILQHDFILFVCLMVFNEALNNISVIWCSQFYWWRKPEDPEKSTDLSQVTDKLLSHNIVHLALIEIRTHNINGDMH